MTSLLFVEDDEDLLGNLYSWFESGNYRLDCARFGDAALRQIRANNYDCIILDINLPRINGFDLCRIIRTELASQAPVIMLTARDAVEDRVLGLDAGADDYLVKPFSLMELEARIRALLRRSSGRLSQRISFGPLAVRLDEKKAYRDGKPLPLTPTGLRILEVLLARAPGIVSRQELESSIWHEPPPSPSALRNHILELRRTMDKPFSCPLLETVPYLGYRIKDVQE